MVVGQRILYTNFINIDKKRSAVKGRSVIEIERRNLLICYRYFYYVYHKKTNYTDSLIQLNNEHFITETTIVKILTYYQKELKEIFNTKPSISELKRLYAWLVWN